MNALALALLAVEVRARAAIVEQIEKALTNYAGYLAAVIADTDITNGTALLSRADLHQALTMLLGAAQRNVSDSIRTAYTAAVQVARTETVATMNALGHEVGDDLGDLGGTLAALLLDIQNAFGHAQTELQNNIRDAFDGVTGTDPKAARTVATNQAVRNAMARLRLRAVTTGTTAVHQGARDAQTAVFRRYSDMHGYATVKKRWIVTSKTPCGMCAALHGTVADLNDEFDRTATRDGTPLRRVYLDLQGPPRHPNCRCQIELVVS